jgi:hypothetical protein
VESSNTIKVSENQVLAYHEYTKDSLLALALQMPCQIMGWIFLDHPLTA